MSTSADKEINDFLAELDADFGKKKAPAHKGLNKAFHAANPQIPGGRGKSPERLNPEDSAAWRPVEKITHVVIQECTSCLDVSEHIGGEYVKFVSVRNRQDHPTIIRRAEQCSTLFLFDSIDEPLEDLIEWHYQKVARCSGCIRVDQQAQAVLWEQQLAGQQANLRGQKLDHDLTELEIDL